MCVEEFSWRGQLYESGNQDLLKRDRIASDTSGFVPEAEGDSWLAPAKWRKIWQTFVAAHRSHRRNG